MSPLIKLSEITKRRGKRGLKFIVRFTIGSAFFIVCLNFSNSVFFNENPLFGVNFLAEVVISSVGALIGFFLIPDYFFKLRRWIEQLVSKIVFELVSDFWNQYNQKMEMTRKNRAMNAKKKKNKQSNQKEADKVRGGTLLDTSVLIDGRILNIAKSGFITGLLVVHKSVISELQLLADSEDVMKRKKGRRGLDALNELKKYTKVAVIRQNYKTNKVDDVLVAAASECRLKIMTLDFNLKKIAEVQNIKVLNINELVEAVKPDYIPGDTLSIKIVQEGKEKDQGVGYLDDGTMVVVSNSSDMVGSVVEVRFQSSFKLPQEKWFFVTK